MRRSAGVGPRRGRSDFGLRSAAPRPCSGRPEQSRRAECGVQPAFAKASTVAPACRDYAVASGPRRDPRSIAALLRPPRRATAGKIRPGETGTHLRALDGAHHPFDSATLRSGAALSLPKGQASTALGMTKRGEEGEAIADLRLEIGDFRSLDCARDDKTRRGRGSDCRFEIGDWRFQIPRLRSG